MSTDAVASRYSLGDIHVLHVDDEPDFADMAATFLERDDDRFDVKTATSASEGVDRLASDDFDCVVSDHDMPGQNGIEFLEAVREEYPDLPFVLFTGKGSEEIASDAISAGVSDYLQKGAGTDQYTVLANRIWNLVEKYRAEQDAERTRSRLEAITANSNDAILTIDANSIVRFANTAVEDLFGYPADDLTGESLTKIIPPRYRDEHREAITRYLETGEQTLNWNAIEFPAHHRDGHEISVSVSFSEYNEDGEHRFVGIIRDISGRVRMEEELREREQRFRQMAENISEVVWMSDPDKQEIFYVNPAYEAIWGRSVEDVYDESTSFLDAIHPEDRDRVEKAIDTQTTGDYDEEYRIVKPDGDVRWIRDRAIPVTNDAGEVYQIVGIASDITDRNEREQEYARVVDLLDHTERIADVGGWEIEPETQAVFWTDHLFEMLGVEYEEEPQLGEALDVYVEEDQPRVENAIEEALATGESFDIEARFERPDGDIRWLQIQGEPVVEDGEVVTLRGAVRDITDHKEQMAELEATASRLEALFENSPDMIDVLDPEGTVLDVNHRFCEELGYEEDDVLGRPIWKIDHLADEDDVRRLLADCGLGERRTVERVYQRCDGSTIPVEVHLLRLEVAGEDRFMAISRDITERKQFEHKITALHGAAHDLFHANTRDRVGEHMVEAAHNILGMGINGVAVHDESENVLRVIAQTGRSAEVLRPDLVFRPGESLAWEAFETGEVKRYEDVSTVPGRANPDTLIRSEIIVPLGEHGVAVIGSTDAGVFDDVDVSLVETLASHAEAALDRIAHGRELEQQNDRLAEFASVVSHDLRNPLNVAQGRLELAQAECDSEHLDDVENALERSQALIDDLLTLAQEGTRADDIEAVDLGTFTENCWHTVATGEATITVDIDRAIRADQSRLQQLLENLYRNAIEHGGEDVAVTVSALPDGFYVEDDGSGIPADKREDVFDAGYSTSEDGTGFGLSIVQQIADAHGWDVRVTDGSDGGARFEITGVEFSAE